MSEQIGSVMHLCHISSGDVQRIISIGETRFSFVASHGKYAKREYSVVSEQEYIDCQWAYKNRYKIAQLLDDRRKVGGATLRQIAALIGYQES